MIASAPTESTHDRQPATAGYYTIAGMTIAVTADLPVTRTTFAEKFVPFAVDGPGADTIRLHHHFTLPAPETLPVGEIIRCTPPWEVQRLADGWRYQGLVPEAPQPPHVALFAADYRQGELYMPNDTHFRAGNWHSLTFFPTDQILLAPLLAARRACLLHAAGMLIDGHGLLFVGHSGAGKSTTVTMLQDDGTILCDDRSIVRRWPDGFHAHGTWSHGDVAAVSAAHAPLRALLFLEQAPVNALMPITDRREVIHRLLFTLIRPVVTVDWWEKTLDVVEQLVQEVPAYRLQLDRSGAVRGVIADLLRG